MVEINQVFGLTYGRKLVDNFATKENNVPS